MPIFDHHYLGPQSQPAPDGLKNIGAVLPVEVSVPQALEDFLKARKQRVPAPIKGMALIDTGATSSCAEESILRSLGINSIGIVRMGTAKGAMRCSLFPAKLIFPTLKLRTNMGAVAGVSLQGQVIQNTPLLVLVGREILRRCLLIYSGTHGYYSLSY